MDKKTLNYIFDERKAAEAAAFLLSLNNSRLPYLKLIKLLYISDRISLSEYHSSITTDAYVSMKLGPVTSGILDRIKHSADYSDKGPWKSIIRTDGYDVSLKHDFVPCFLSEEEMDVLRYVNNRYGKYEKFDLAELTHMFPEWQNPGNSSIPIQIEDILFATIDDDEKRNQAAEDIMLSAHLHNISYRDM